MPMSILKPTLRVAPVALATLVLVAGCDRPKPRPGAAAPGPAGAPAQPAAPPTPTTTEAPPPVPAWAEAYMGRPLNDVLPTQSTECVGNTDNVNLRYQGATPGTRVEGWGWDRTANKPVEHVLLIDDHTGVVIGAGQSGKPRPDVVRARPEVTSPTTGWEAVTPKTTGGLYAFGLLADGKSVCRLGHIAL
jgi:hypothetical protein